MKSPESKKFSRYYPDGTDLAYVPITLEEELVKARAAKAGDIEARNFLLTNHLLFAKNRAKKMGRCDKGGLREDDVISAANLAIFKALEKFDPERGFRFTVLLLFYIRREITALWEETKTSGFPEPHESPDSVEAAPDWSEEHNRFLEAALKECERDLTPAELELIELHYYQGHSLAEIGRLRNPPVVRATVSKLHIQVLAKLRAALQKRGINSAL